MSPLPAVLAALVLAALPAAAEDAGARRTVQVTGEGEVAVAPDRARVEIGVTAEAGAAADAMDRASAAMEEVMAALRDAGLEARDLATTSITLSPVYARPEGRDEAPRVAAYRAGNLLSATVREIDALGAVIDAAARAGATDVRGIAFETADDAAAADRAREAAFADARRRAALFADAAGATLGPALAISEGGVARPAFDAMAFAAEARSVPVAPGERAVRASVSVTFALE